jgi:protein xylosyltransferase
LYFLLQIGSEWDGKESMFRNLGGILGAWDDPVAALRLKGGSPGEINIIWDDPVGERVSTFVMKLEASWFVSFHKPKVERPIRPGVWTVKVTLPPKDGGTVLMQNQFLVVPITHENRHPLSDPLAVNAKRTVTIKPSMDPKQFAQWRSNVSKTGPQLEHWMDSLVAKHWIIEGYCRTSKKRGEAQGEGAAPPKECSWIPDCTSTSWSSFSTDPKSEIGKIQPNGRIR